jgi:rhomboid domain-containing protein 1
MSQLFQEYNQRGLPPITLSAILGQILVYFRAVPLPWNPYISDSCLSANKIIHYKEYSKILISQIEHGDDWHLYYNVSLNIPYLLDSSVVLGKVSVSIHRKYK